MATESGNKRNVTSGAVSISDRFTDPILVPIPVGEPKAEEAAELIQELWKVARAHYLKTEHLSPEEISRIFQQIGVTWDIRGLRITEEKYNGHKRSESRLRNKEV